MKRIACLAIAVVLAAFLSYACNKKEGTPVGPPSTPPTATPPPTSTPTVTPTATPTATPTQTPCSGIVQGYATPAGTPICFNDDTFQSFPVTVGGSPVTVNALTIYAASGAAGTVRVALYTNNPGSDTPITLLSESGTRTVAPDTMMTLSIPPVTLAAGAMYWIAFQMTSGCLPMYQVGPGRRYVADYAWGPFPAIAPSGYFYTLPQPVGYANACP